MSSHLEAPAEARQPPLGKTAMVARLTLIGIILAGALGTFAYLGRWLTPKVLTPTRFVDGFEEVNGVHSGFRRNHAKGVGVSGFFESNGNGVRLSKAVVFQPGRVPVLGRFSLGGGQPEAADTPAAVRGLGLQFSLPDGELWRTAMINLPVFPVRTPEAFYEQLIASKPDPATGKPDPANLKAFLASHPETVEALKVIEGEPASSGFGNSTFYGLNAFHFTNAAGDAIPVRWFLRPMQPFEAASTAPAPQDKNYLVRSADRAHSPPAVAMASHRHRRAAGRYDQRCYDRLAGGDGNRSTSARSRSIESRATTPVPRRDINFDPLVLTRRASRRRMIPC